MLRQWLAQTLVIPDENELVESESKHQKKELERKQSDPVLETTVQYSLRILEQCDRSKSRIKYDRMQSINFYRPQRSWGKVIFSVACVKNSVHRGGSTWAGASSEAGTPPSRYRHPPGQVYPPSPGQVPLWQVHPLAGTPPRAGTSPSAGTPPRQVHPLGALHAGRYGQQVGRYTPHGTHPGSIACQEIRTTSGRYASYWNAFLLYVFFCKKIT